MIDLENLNNQSVGEILEDAKRQIMYLSNKWTNNQESDPGITLLELMVWLKWVQHEYLNRISVGVKDKFLQLLDVKRYKNKGARALIEVSGLRKDIRVPQGTHWKAGRMIFTNREAQNLVASQILSLEFNNPSGKLDEEYYRFDGKRIFYLFGSEFRKVDDNKNREFIIKFSSILPSNRNINIYFDVYLGKNLKRNPIGPEDFFEEMAAVKWEYYGVKDGIKGWHELKIVKDQTHRFLFSGIVVFNISGKMISCDGVYTLRVRLLKREYDFPPAITSVKMNVFEVAQGDVKCENIILKKKEVKDLTITVENHIALYGKHIVYLKKKNGWVIADGFTFERNIDEGKIRLRVNSLDKIINELKDEDNAVMVISYNPEIENKMLLGSGDGTSFQNFEFRETNVLYDGFELMIGEKQGSEEFFSVWNRVDDFFSSSKYDKHYVLDEQGEKIIFGDHFLGMAPRRGENNIRLCRLETCMGERSNIKKGMINSVVTENEILKRARVVQISDAEGGQDVETMEHAQARSADLFSKCGRAVTMEDYERIVSETPGLIMKNIRILPNYINGKTVTDQNCVTIAVRWNNEIDVSLPESYKRNIIRQIDRYRLINTKIDVIGPVYVGLVVSGEIVVNSFYKQNDKLVEKQIKTFVDNLNKKFGQTLHYGDLFGMIDRLDYVSHLEKLNIIPKGSFIEKTSSEDIVVPPNAVYYIDSIEMSYIRDSYI